MQKVLAGKSPRDRAAELVNGTKLDDVDVRKKLYEGGKAAVDASNDPMIELAKLVDAEARERPQDHGDAGRGAEAAGLRQDRQGQVRRRGDQHLSRRDLHAAAGVRHVKGYEEDGKKIPFETTFAGLYEQAEGAEQQAAVRPAAALDRAEGQART